MNSIHLSCSRGRRCQNREPEAELQGEGAGKSGLSGQCGTRASRRHNEGMCHSALFLELRSTPCLVANASQLPPSVSLWPFTHSQHHFHNHSVIKSRKQGRAKWERALNHVSVRSRWVPPHVSRAAVPNFIAPGPLSDSKNYDTIPCRAGAVPLPQALGLRFPPQAMGLGLQLQPRVLASLTQALATPVKWVTIQSVRTTALRE